MSKRIVTSLTTLLLALLVATSIGFAQKKGNVNKEKSLYDRLGGVYAIAALVDDFIDRVVANDILNANPAIKEARSHLTKAGFKYRLTEQVCMVTGGPCKYTGRSMKESHKHLNITEKEWDAFVVDFKASLAKFNIPEEEQSELLAIVGSTKKDIVMTTQMK
jgi:hemoglobin